MSEFNFDYWADLYKTNPTEYENQRRMEINKIIDSAPVQHQHSLKQLQWKLDVIHQTQTPIEGTFNMMNEMWSSFFELESNLRELVVATQVTTPKLSLVVNNKKLK